MTRTNTRGCAPAPDLGRRRLLVAGAGLAAARFTAAWAEAPEGVRVAVVGGIALCGVWERLAPRLQAGTGRTVETIAAAPKEGIVPPFRRGDANVLLIHGSDESLALAYQGVAGPLRVWGANEHVIVGPAEDPAGIRGLMDGAAALKRIAGTRASMIGFRDPGSHGVLQNLIRRSGVNVSSDWLLVDALPEAHQVLELASQRRAYVIVGHIPVVFEKLRGDGLEVLVRGDPRMRRPYVVLEPGPRHPASEDGRAAARRFADYLVSDSGQADLVAADRAAGGPWIFPLAVT
jgi:tungstate transport system substrate-binding protein